jgi:hypothetical protein
MAAVGLGIFYPNSKMSYLSKEFVRSLEKNKNL